MKSATETLYVLEDHDHLLTTKFEDGSAALTCTRYPHNEDSTRGFRIDFLPCHIPHLESLIALLKGAAFLAIASLCLWSTPVYATPSQDFCPTLMTQATTMLESQNESDRRGRIIIPATIAQEDQKAYRKLIRRGRFLHKRYQHELTSQTILTVLWSDCADVVDPGRHGAY